MNINRRNIQVKLDTYLSKKGITQGEFAESIGISKQSLSNAFRDKQRFPEEFFIGIMFQYPDLNLYQLFNPAIEAFAMYEKEDVSGMNNERLIVLESTINGIKKLIEKSQL